MFNDKCKQNVKFHFLFPQILLEWNIQIVVTIASMTLYYM